MYTNGWHLSAASTGHWGDMAVIPSMYRLPFDAQTMKMVAFGPVFNGRKACLPLRFVWHHWYHVIQRETFLLAVRAVPHK